MFNEPATTRVAQKEATGNAVLGSAWRGFLRMGLPMTLYLMAPSEARLRKFVSGLLSTLDDDWMPYLGDAFLSFNMNMTIPKLAKVEELKAFTAPTLVLAADDDVAFPGAKLLERAAELFPSLAGAELIEQCRHSPPTTDDFRKWLSARITSFLTFAPSPCASGERAGVRGSIRLHSGPLT